MLKVVDVRFAWDEALPFIERVRKESDTDWRCEDVYAACISGASTMLMPEEVNDGVIVISIETNRYTLNKFLFVWVCCSKDKEAQAKYAEQLEIIAKKEGCLYIEMMSTRKGFERKGGWKAARTVFRKEVNHGANG